MLEPKSNKIYLSSPDFTDNENTQIIECIKQQWIASGGNKVNEFENDIKEYLKKDIYVAALNSGTSAIHLGLILLGVTKGDEVLCQSFTFSATANPILYQGATPVFIDSESDTWNICPNTLEEAIKDRIKKGIMPKAIIAVHLFGVPYKVDDVRVIANKYGIPILEDSAEAIGSSYKGEKCGTFGDVAVFSFNGNKIISSSGGGALIVSSQKMREEAIFYATQSRDDYPYYQHSCIGYNYRMSNLSAAIGVEQLKVIERHIENRRNMNTFYKEIFLNIDGVHVFKVPNEDWFSNCWLTTIYVDSNFTDGKTSTDLRIYLEGKNIESRPLWKPLHLQPIFNKYPYYGINNLAKKIFENGLCLPSGSNLNQTDRDKIKSNIITFFNKNK